MKKGLLGEEDHSANENVEFQSPDNKNTATFLRRRLLSQLACRIPVTIKPHVEEGGHLANEHAGFQSQQNHMLKHDAILAQQCHILTTHSMGNHRCAYLSKYCKINEFGHLFRW